MAPQNDVSSVTQKQKEVLATVLIGLYTGTLKTYGHDEADRYGWSMNLVHLKRKELPIGLDRPESLANWKGKFASLQG